MAVGWVYAEAVPLAAQVGEAARESTPLAAGLCSGMLTSHRHLKRQCRWMCVALTIRLLSLSRSCGLTRMSAHTAGSTSVAVHADSICVSVEKRDACVQARQCSVYSVSYVKAQQTCCRLKDSWVHLY